MKSRFAIICLIIAGAVYFAATVRDPGGLNSIASSAPDAAIEQGSSPSPVPVASPSATGSGLDDSKESPDLYAEFMFTPTAPPLWPLDTTYDPVIVKRHNEIRAWKIDLDRALVAAIEPGEQINLYIPQTDRRITITLNSIKQGRHSESRIATIDGSDGAYSAYFTLGKNTLYGGIETPEGVFHVEQDGSGDAVIYSRSEIHKNLDYSVSDAVVVSATEQE